MNYSSPPVDSAALVFITCFLSPFILYGLWWLFTQSVLYLNKKHPLKPLPEVSDEEEIKRTRARIRENMIGVYIYLGVCGLLGAAFIYGVFIKN